MLLSYIIVGLILVGIFIYLWLQWNEKRSQHAFKIRGVRYIPQTNTIISLMRKERTELTKHEIINREKVKTFGFNLLNTYTILVADPDIAGQVLSKNFTTFINRRYMKFEDPIFGSVLSNALDDQWKRLRSIMTPIFSAGSLRRMKTRIDDTIGNLLNNIESSLKDGSNVDVKHLYGAFTLDTIIQIAFGVKVDSLTEPDNPIILHARKITSQDMGVKDFGTVMLLFMMPKVAKLFGIRFQKETLDYFQRFIENIIEKKRETLQDGNGMGKGSSFLELVLEIEAEHEQQLANQSLNDNKKIKKWMTTDEKIAQCIILLLADYDTAATAITLASYMLALYPEEQEKLYEEIITVTERLKHENPEQELTDLINTETLSRFEYMNGVVCETLRLYAPATMTERTASNDIVLENLDQSIQINVKKGDVIFLPIYSMHRDPEQFPDPESFRPERFIGEPSFHKYSYLPFGSGPRNCVAKSLALLMVKLALLHTVRMYRFSRCEQTKIPFDMYYQNTFILPRDIILKMERRL